LHELDMNLFALTPAQVSAGQMSLAAVLAIVGFTLLLPRPRGRSVAGGIAALLAAATVFVVWLDTVYGHPMADRVGTVLFWLFSSGALVFGTILVVQRNPARGAIAFAFVILSTCGLFLLLAAPFLMAVTIIVYAGAIIVTFLFVLMLSQVAGPSNENDRSREPLFGSLAGFAFAGLVLFSLYLSTSPQSAAASAEGAIPGPPEQRLPIRVLAEDERKALREAVARLDEAEARLGPEAGSREDRLSYFEAIRDLIATVVGSSIPTRDGSLRLRLEHQPTQPGVAPELLRKDEQAQQVLHRADRVQQLNDRTFTAVEGHLIEGKPDRDAVRAQLRALREEVLLLASATELPSRTVANLGFVLYSEYLLAVELTGVLLLVATIGAIAIARRKGATP
jgi:NADH:ubiquinone oxidoreductase subunit 6 (subunit J)